MTNITMTMTKAEADVAYRINGCFVWYHPTEDMAKVITRFPSLKAFEEFIHAVRVSAACGSTNAGLQNKATLTRTMLVVAEAPGEDESLNKIQKETCTTHTDKHA